MSAGARHGHTDARKCFRRFSRRLARSALSRQTLLYSVLACGQCSPTCRPSYRPGGTDKRKSLAISSHQRALPNRSRACSTPGICWSNATNTRERRRKWMACRSNGPIAGKIGGRSVLYPKIARRLERFRLPNAPGIRRSPIESERNSRSAASGRSDLECGGVSTRSPRPHLASRPDA